MTTPRSGAAAGEVLADGRLDLAAAERDPVLAGHGDLVPPVEVMLGVGGVTARRVVAEIVAEPAGDLGHVVGMRDGVVVGLAVGVGVPLAEDPVLGLDRLADEPAAGLVRLQVVLVALDAGRELGGILARVVAGPLDVVLVELLEVLVEPALDLGRDGLSGCSARNWRARSIWSDKRDVGQRLGADQVVDELPLAGDPAGGQLVLERPGQGQGLGASGSVGELAEEGVDRGQRCCGVVDGGQREGLGLDGLPALVVPDLLLGRFDLADRGGRAGAPGP